MTAEQLKALKRADPFRPFAIFTNGGERFEVLRSLNLLIAGNIAVIGIDVDPGDCVPEGVVYRPVDSIERIEEITQGTRRGE